MSNNKRAAEKISETWHDRVNLYSGFPALGMSKKMEAIDRIEKITGQKTNQLLRALKDCSMSAFRHINKGINNVPHKAPKAYIDKKIAEGMLANSIFREHFLELHASRAFLKEAGKSASKIPVIEYVLLERWNPELKGLSDGSFADEYAPSLYAQAKAHSDTVDDVGSLKAGVGCYNPLGYQKTPFPSSLLSNEHLCTEITSPWETQARFVPFWLEGAFSMAYRDLLSWQDKSEKDKALLAGALFALCSAYRSHMMMVRLLHIEPELATFYEGVTLPQVSSGQDNSKHSETAESDRHDGSVWAHSLLNKSDRKVAILSSEICRVSNKMLTAGTTAVTYIKMLLEQSEDLLSERGKIQLQELQGNLDKVTSDISNINSFLERSGSEESLLHLLKYTLACRKFLDDSRWLMLDSSESDLLDEMKVEFATIEKYVSNLTNSLEEHETVINEILSKDISALMKAKNVADAQEEFKCIEVGCCDYDLEFESKKAPDFPAELERREPKAKTEEDLLTDELETKKSEITELQTQNSDLQSNQLCLQEQVATLRKENAELTVRSENLLQSLSCSGKMDASVLSAELMTAVEAVIENKDAGSVLRFLEAAYPDRVRVLDSVYENLEGSNIPVSSLYTRAKALVCQGVDVMRNSGRLIDIRDVVPGSLSAKESETVRSSPRFRAFRTFNDNGEQRVIYPHMAIDYSHRLYFDYLDTERRMVIGYVGRHLPSAKSTTI